MMDSGQGFQAFARNIEHHCRQDMDDAKLAVADVVDCWSVQNDSVLAV